MIDLPDFGIFTVAFWLWVLYFFGGFVDEILVVFGVVSEGEAWNVSTWFAMEVNMQRIHTE